jgi:hypothetical protein
VIAQLVEIHRHDQREAGHDDTGKVTPSCCPLTDLKGFDSLLIPPIVRRLAKAMGRPLPKGTRVKNIYVDGGRKLTIKEIAKRFVGEYVPEVCKT